MPRKQKEKESGSGQKEVTTNINNPTVAKSPTQLKNNFKGITAMLVVPPPMTNHRKKFTCSGSGIRQTEDVEIVCTAHFYRFYFYLTNKCTISDVETLVYKQTP